MSGERFTHGPRRVVALHGFTRTPADLAALARSLEADVLALDLPGHSGAPPPSSFAEAIARIVAEVRAAGFTRADWIGYSMGGRLALAVAAAKPALVRSLVVVGGSAGIADDAERASRRAADERWAAMLEEEGLAAFLERWDAQPIVRRMALRPTSHPSTPLGVSGGGHETRHLTPAHGAHALAVALRCLGAGAQPPVDDAALARIECPVLLVAGEADVKFADIARSLAPRLPRATVALVANAGHAVHADAPRALADRIHAFWRTETMLPDWKTQADFEDIRYETAEGIAKVTIDRPEVRNAFRPQTVVELERAFALARDDAEVGVVILTGAGTEAFCSGGDQRVRGEGGYVGADGVPRLNVLDLQRRIRSLPKPVIAMVAGYAIGGGHVLHVVCDLTIAAENARFGQTGPRVGSFDGGFGAGSLAALVGPKKAREIWFLCRQYDARAALEMGLVNAVVPLAQLEEETVRWCREILALSPLALRCLKAAFNAETDGHAGLQELAGNATLLYYMTEEAREGKQAFLEKRSPDFARFGRLP